MGTALVDKYSLLHFAAGIVAQYWGLTLEVWIIINVLFEILENSYYGIKFINYTGIWPGGKPEANSIINRTTDIIFSVLGWLFASMFN